MSKKTKDEPSTKTINKNKDKVIQDLTFGLKNKNKSKVVQQYVKEVTAKVQFSNVKVFHFIWVTRNNLGRAKSSGRRS
jgi:hypothetical protein